MTTDAPPIWTVYYRTGPRQPERSLDFSCWTKSKARRLFERKSREWSHYGLFITRVERKP